MKAKVVSCLLTMFSLNLAMNVAYAQQEKVQPPAKAADAPATSRRTESEGSSGPTVLAAMNEDYRIGANDVIDVQIEDAPELSGSRRVNANGTFLMNYLGRLPAKGKTPDELAMDIANGLRGRYLGDPRVTVTVKSYNSRSFFVQGAVRSPGVFVIEGRPTLLELVTVAGGLAEGHGSTAFIIRRIKQPDTPNNVAALDDARLVANNKTATVPATTPTATVTNTAADPQADGSDAPPPQYTLLKANLHGLLKGRFEHNIFLEPGDIVNVPNTDVFFVGGEVKAPGSFPLKDGTTLRQAIALAQGSTFKAAGGRTIIFRENPDNGQRQELKVDLAAVLNGKVADVPILANDIVIVPNSRLKSVTAPMLNAFGMSAMRVPVF